MKTNHAITAAPASGAGTELLAFDRVTKVYRDGDGRPLTIFRELNEVVRCDAMIAFVGASGAGKSTLGNMINGCDTAYMGTVYVNGEPVPKTEGPALNRYRQQDVAFVAQQFNLIPYLTVLDNAAVSLMCRGMSIADARPIAAEYLRKVGLIDKANRRPSTLSGGEQQRNALARALSSDAPIIIADEPTGNLDPENAELVMEAFESIAGAGRTVLLITHNYAHAARCDAVYEIGPGIENITQRLREGRAARGS